MKRLYFVLFCALIAATAEASILGILVSSQSGISITGHLVWECTYNVAGQNQTVVLDHICPSSLQFN